jgi:2-polyprenyl-3-methyl-5-hydroxy-6-metoxy-1,4-benzoquinol methylase
MNVEDDLKRLIGCVIEAWPEHRKFIDRGVLSLDDDGLAAAQLAAQAVWTIIAPDSHSYAADYKAMCGNINDEEFFFRRNKRYRHSTYKEVADFVYHNPDYMRTYMRGLLLSQALWSNHVGVSRHYQAFLSTLNEGTAHLEIGPGHGLFMHQALQSQKLSSCHGWDLSQSSLDETHANLLALGHAPDSFSLALQDANHFAESGVTVDAVTISEVLEHTEDPGAILQAIGQGMPPGAKIFVNIPLNCPAIDHIYLYQEAQAIVTQVEQAGFEISDVVEHPVTGFTLERAKRMQATISVSILATRRT